MATKYGYVSRDRAERQIDWGEIGKQVSDEIVKINEDRKERREDILQKSTDYAKMLVEMPMGSNTAFNEYLAQFTSQASKAALEDLNALKRGEISEQEYYNRRANLKSGTELMIAGANNFNKNYDLIQERIDKGVASLVEIKYREKMAQLLEFGNRTPFINPDTREVNTARLAPSGVMETTVEDIASASDMFRISNFQLNKFDMDKAVNDIKKGIGIQDVTVTQEMIDQGLTTAAVGTRIKSAFNSALMSEEDAEKAKQDLVSSYMKDDAAVISILADYVPGFGVTLDPFEVDENTVLITRNGSYEISDAQRKAAQDYMIKRVDQALPEQVDTSKVQTANEKEIERLRIEVLKNQVEKGNLEIKGIRADDIDTSNLQAEVKRDIDETVGQELINTFDSNYYSLAGGAQKKGSNAVKASLDLLNSYASGFGTTITEDGTNITFSTPAFDASGKALAKPIEISYSLENITDGNTVKALLENFITLYPGKRFINTAYKTGRFNPATGTQATGTQATEIQTTNTDTDTTPVDVNQAASNFGIDLNQINTTTPTGTEPSPTVVEENVTTQEDSPAEIKAKRRNWIKKIKPLTLTEKNDDGSPVFDRTQFQNSARFASVTEKNGGKVKDKFLTAEFARLYPDYPHEIYGQTEVFGKAEEIEANKKQTATDKIKARKNKQAKDKLLSSQTRIEKLIEEVEQEAGRDLSIEEQVEIEKGNLPDIDFSSDFTQKYSYLFD